MRRTPPPESRHQSLGRVLVVDDEQLIRWSIQRHLQAAGYEVLTADSGEACLEVLAANPPDVLLLDLRLPGIDGIEVLKLARQRNPELAVLMLSAQGSVSTAVAAVKLGASDFLTKPFNLEELETSIARTLETVRLRRTVEGLSAERAGSSRQVELTGSSAVLRNLRELIAKVARSDTTTALIRGESGAGKEVVARMIHFGSQRAPKPLMTINCTSLPEHLIESELMGHERGAFTDAKLQKKGQFELAEGGTVLLDEIGDMPLGAQAKLLRVLEEKRFKRVGGTVDLRVDVRIIAATHRDLKQYVADGRFRHDLYHRLNIVTIDVPPLRAHLDDLPELTAHFVARFNRELGREVRGISAEALDVMWGYEWPGNVRELKNVIERAFILEPRDEIGVEHLPPEITERPIPASNGAEAAADLDLRKHEETMIRAALDKTAGNQTHAAEILGITRDTLRYRMRKYGLLG